MTVPLALAQELPPPEQVEKEPSKMDPRLVDLYEAAVAGDAPTPNSSLPTSADSQRVQVILEMVSAEAPVPQGLGIVVETQYENLVQVNVPVMNLEAVASDDNVVQVKLPSRPVPGMVQPTMEDIPSGDGFDPAYLILAVTLPAAVVALVWRKRSRK